MNISLGYKEIAHILQFWPSAHILSEFNATLHRHSFNSHHEMIRQPRCRLKGDPSVSRGKSEPCHARPTVKSRTETASGGRCAGRRSLRRLVVVTAEWDSQMMPIRFISQMKSNGPGRCYSMLEVLASICEIGYPRIMSPKTSPCEHKARGSRLANNNKTAGKQKHK
ncbi:hypothetical protein CEXT_540111 [Caerostris extrusa]|uniref:Uncharacterized protein n=1 Tax=Caerostris extrusa TaxID=172846 RepID=A0AAV4T8I3_CAEEX|nr:hypothetical protein CEXT_540111 [Caerostris extrusa]